VEVVAGAEWLSPPAPEEEHLKGNFRLSCRTQVVSPEGDVRCHTMRRGQMRIETAGRTIGQAELDPAVTRDGERILIDGVEVERSTGPIHGIAMDLGTTTVVLRLADLETGRTVAATSFENPQRFAGSDIMARIAYDTEHRGKLMARTLAGYLSHAIEEFPVDPKNPYHSITEIEVAEGRRKSTVLENTGRRCLLPIHPKARVYGAPIISGHVGADAAACMLAVDIAHEDRLVAVMDIGTNTELIVGNRHRILAASCPAGPAFEGGAIACGMPALDGAIEDVAIEGGEFRLATIGGGAPEGICGSGLVALMGELMRTGRMNARGRFEEDGHRITLDREHDIYVLESDINELAQAKGANVAGLHVVAANYGVDFDRIEICYLAGGFGRHLNVDAARRIGLIPNFADEKFVQAGNAAIEGATLALLSARKRRELEELVKRVEHCRLETHPRFFDFFVEGCQFKPVESMDEVAG